MRGNEFERELTVIRKGKSGPERIVVNQESELQPGDVIEVTLRLDEMSGKNKLAQTASSQPRQNWPPRQQALGTPHRCGTRPTRPPETRRLRAPAEPRTRRTRRQILPRCQWKPRDNSCSNSCRAGSSSPTDHRPWTSSNNSCCYDRSRASTERLPRRFPFFLHNGIHVPRTVIVMLTRAPMPRRRRGQYRLKGLRRLSAAEGPGSWP